MERIFECEPKYGGLLVHIDDTDRYDYHTKNPACTGEVVRCRDCRHYAFDNSDHEWREPHSCQLFICDVMMPDDFCSRGVRRDA